MYDHDKSNKNLCLKKIIIARNAKEMCLIEGSINSVRVSVKFNQNDEIEKLICGRFTKFFAARADMFEIFRKEPVKGYDISFLIMDVHLQKYKKEDVIEFIAEVIYR